MYRIRAITTVDSRLFVEYPDAKESVISKLLIEFANEMLLNNCLEVKEVDMKAEKAWLDIPKKQLTTEGYVLTPLEHKTAIETLHLIKSALPESLKRYADLLHSILTPEME